MSTWLYWATISRVPLPICFWLRGATRDSSMRFELQQPFCNSHILVYLLACSLPVGKQVGWQMPIMPWIFQHLWSLCWVNVQLRREVYHLPLQHSHSIKARGSVTDVVSVYSCGFQLMLWTPVCLSLSQCYGLNCAPLPSPRKLCWSPYPQYRRVRPYLEMRSLQRSS